MHRISTSKVDLTTGSLQQETASGPENRQALTSFLGQKQQQGAGRDCLPKPIEIRRIHVANRILGQLHERFVFRIAPKGPVGIHRINRHISIDFVEMEISKSFSGQIADDLLRAEAPKLSDESMRVWSNR